MKQGLEDGFVALRDRVDKFIPEINTKVDNLVLASKNVSEENRRLFDEDKGTPEKIHKLELNLRQCIADSNKSMSEKTDRLADDNKSMFGEIKSMSEKTDRLADDNKSMFGEIKSLSGKTDRLANDNKSMFGEIKSLSGKTDRLADDNKSMSGKIDELANDNKSMSGEIHKLELNLTQRIADEGNNMSEKIQKLDVKISPIAESYNNVKRSMAALLVGMIVLLSSAALEYFGVI